MKQKTIKLYSYDELSKEAQEKVLEDFREHNDFYFLEEDLKELLSEQLNKNRLNSSDDLQLYYSLSYSQGDGACFTGSFKWNGYDINIKHSGNYYHKRSTQISVYSNSENRDEEDEEQEANEGIYKQFLEIYSSICDKIERTGYKIMEEENSEACIKDNIEANGYTFRENGEMENE